MQRRIWATWVLLCFGALLIAAEKPAATKPKATSSANEAEAGESVDRESAEERERIMRQRFKVVGSKEEAFKQPGSAHYLGKEVLEKQQYTDVHRILRQVPGVNIQEEDGYGLRPNIGMRGTGVERSQKITLMEDGVLIAPAPYTAPAAYYFPTAGRMSGIEVMKGPAAVKQGPYTNGGVLNLISTDIPSDFGVDLDLAGGSDSTYRGHLNVGDAKERWGYMLEAFALDTDGFKELDNNGDTGVELRDYLGKFRFNSNPDADIYQALEIKVGTTEQFGNETYLGLTAADYAATPNRRYAGSQEDFIDTDHKQYQVRYFVQPSANLDITTTAYFNDYFRNWHKMERTGGVSNRTILENPELYADLLGVIRGDLNSDQVADGTLQIRNNRRQYESRGIQSVLHTSFETGSLKHNFEFGIRIHEDEEDRSQNDEAWSMVNGNMVFDRFFGVPGTQTNRFSYAEARAFFVSDTILAGNWTFRPGLRFEDIDYTREDYSTADPDRSEGPTRIRENSVEAFVPGLGIDYALNNRSRVFVGIHRGFSPPGAGQNEETEEERSTNYEFGYRYAQNELRFEVIGFFNDYSNLLGAETVSGGGGVSGELFNGGEVDVQGIEMDLKMNFANYFESNLAIPFGVTLTHTTSEFQNSFETGFADWSPAVEAGDELPYIPENQLAFNIGVVGQHWAAYLNNAYVDEMRTKAGQGDIPQDELIEDHFTTDISVEYRFLDRYKVYGQVRNLFDETYLVSRRPYGVRPGLDRTFLMGIKANF